MEIKLKTDNNRTEALGYTAENCDQLSHDLKKELETIGGTMRIHIAWGCKQAAEL